MVKPVIIILGAVPALAAILISVPLLTQQDIPFSAAVPGDAIEIEYSVHDLRVVSFGVTERLGADRSQILTIRGDGDVRLLVTEGGYPQPTVRQGISEDEVMRLVALIKETGFMAIPEDTFPVSDGIIEYARHTVKITLNGATTQITWPEQNATEAFIPPIITLVQERMDAILVQTRDN